MNIEELKEKAVYINKLYEKYDKERSFPENSVDRIVMSFASDVGDLGRYIEKIEREGETLDLKEGVARELAECLAHVMVLTYKYGIDLEGAYMKEFARLESELTKRP
jgi:NTP pyrophosphatase (non-canonical NTP hydrolase)